MQASTGLPDLDRVVNGLRLGDNVVWQIDSIDAFADIVGPFARRALAEKRRLVYVRFAGHRPLIQGGDGAAVYELDASAGFESFSTQLNGIIGREGDGVFYVFDCLSELLFAWSNDLMVGNFFKITCPYLFELNTVAYFCLLRNHHSFKTIARIRDTTQLLLDLYDFEDRRYVHPLKVWNRYSPTMFLPHVQEGDRFEPVANSADTAKLFSGIFKRGTEAAERRLDYWDRMFMKAEELAASGAADLRETSEMVDRLCRMIIAREEKLLGLARTFLGLEDFLTIKSRMIGTGFIGGKTVGMLIARSIVSKDAALARETAFEPHDSFYIGSDVFYTYLVENGWWKSRMEQRTEGGYFSVARELREKLLKGGFPEEIKEQFQRIIEYYGQSPIIVRSSSLLEDSFGNAFAGKYESIFLVNQGNPEQRYARFVDAVRRIYASTMNEDALAYRRQRGLDQADEQMALLVQRVSGAYRGEYFFPDVAGVAVSYNTFVWKNTMDPKAGVMRLVFGLGTRAVNRVDGDYPRIVALDDPLLQPHAGMKDARKYSQKIADVLNVAKNEAETVQVRDLLVSESGVPRDLVASRDEAATEQMRALGIEGVAWILTFEKLLSQTGFVPAMRRILGTLEAAYGYPVDVEFTGNMDRGGTVQINLLQCRPLQTKGLGRRADIPASIPRNDILLEARGNFVGGNVSQTVDRVVYVDPAAYTALPSQSERYDVARAVGALNRLIESKEKTAVMLLGPGRWGTTTPSLGVPVSFAEINNMSILGEIAFAAENVVPEISFGTHFFQDLVETGTFYLALPTEGEEAAYMDREFLQSLPRNLGFHAPEYAKYDGVIKVFDPAPGSLRICADVVSQRLVCWFADRKEEK